MMYQSNLDKLRIFFRTHGQLPTYEEMQTILHYKSKSTCYYAVNKLVEEGFIRRKNHKLLPGGNFVGTPYFQSVRAGFPGPAEEEANDRLSLDQYLIDKPNSTLLIRVKGDSMVNAGIFEGDVVIVERTPNAKAGDIVVVNLEGEFTVKTLRRDGSELFLDPSNPRYPSIRMADYADHALVGVVRGVVRKYAHV